MTRRRGRRPTKTYRNANVRRWGGRGGTASAKYSAGGSTRLRGYRSHGTDTAEWQAVNTKDRTEVRETLRRLDKANTILGRILDAGQHNIIGRGPRIIPSTSDPAWNDAAQAIWTERTAQQNFSVEKIHNEWQLGLNVWRSKERDGGCIVYHPFRRVQTFEDGQLVTPRDVKDKTRVKDGVQFAKNGSLDGYWIGPYSRWGYPKQSDCMFLPAWKVDKDFQVMLPRTIYFHNTRFLSGYRGWSAFAATLDDFERIGEYVDAILERAVEEACIMGTLHSDRENASDSLNVGRSGDSSSDTVQQVYDKVAYLEPGTVPNLAKEDKFEIHGITTPNNNFDSFLSMLVRLVGLPGSLPTELSLLKFNDTNFSASRAAIEQAKLYWISEKTRFADAWSRPNYTWCIYEAILSGDLTYRDDWRAVTIRHDGWRYLNPKDDAVAIAKRLDSGEANLTDVLAERGVGLHDHLIASADEVVMAQKVADEKGVDVEILLKHAYGKVGVNDGNNSQSG